MHRRYANWKNAERKAAGLCKNCGKRAQPNRTRCKACALKANAPHNLARMTRYRSRLRARVYDHYGRRCACCGESDERFLTLDHVANDGKAHRLTVKNTTQLHRWLITNDFPATLQVLCWNCNQGKRLYGGVCPHKELTDRISSLYANHH